MPNVRHRFARILTVAVVAAFAVVSSAGRPRLAAAADAPAAALVVGTADTEGHVNPCRTCPMHAGDGGLARRATAIAGVRPASAGGPALLADAGNALFGPESVADRGRVIVAAYDALGYDAVNLSYRDFRYGRAHTLGLFAGTKVKPVSANLLDDQTGAPLVAPFVVKPVGGMRVAVVGVTEPPPGGADLLPHLKKQLAGVRVGPPAAAVAEWVPKARQQADAVVVLYYGSAAGLVALRGACGKDVLAVVAGGLRAAEVPAGIGPPVVVPEEHGKSLALVAADGSASDRRVTSDFADDPAVAKLLADQAAAAGPDQGLPAGPVAAAGPATSPSGMVGQPAKASTAVTPPEVRPAEASASSATAPTAGPAAAGGPPPSATASPPAATVVPDPTALPSLVTAPAPPPAAPAMTSPPPTPPTVPAPTALTPATGPTPSLALPDPPPAAAAPTAAPAMTATASPAATRPRPKFCTECGRPLGPTARFCTECGHKVGE